MGDGFRSAERFCYMYGAIRPPAAGQSDPPRKRRERGQVALQDDLEIAAVTEEQ